LTIQKTNTQITRNALPEILGNEIQLIQLWQNLIANGIRYTSEVSPIIHIGVEVQAEK